MNIFKNRQLWFYILSVFLLNGLFIENIQAKVWANAYLNFEIPDRWRCVLEQTEWLCRSEDAKESKEAIIILTAKEADATTDTYQKYEEHLSKPISVPLRGGGNELSKVYKKPEYIQIQSQRWLDGFHLGSEVPSYFTRYLATIKESIAVLITFSAHKDEYAKYSSDFTKAIQSLRVIASKNLIASGGGSGAGMRGSNDPLFGSGQGLLPSEPIPSEMPTKQKSKGLLYGLIAILAAIGVYIFIKVRKS
ncbi:MAG: hypothetical protein AABY64_08065 [Bdellovibrionota bacterium]